MKKYHLILTAVVALASSGALENHAKAFTLINDPSLYSGWNTRQLTFHVNTTGCTVSADQFKSAVDAALQLWSTVNTSDIVLSRGSDSTSTFAQVSANHTTAQDPEIICDTSFQADVNMDQNAVTGVGGYQGVGSDRKYFYGAVIMNASGGKADIVNLSSVQLAVAIAHEIGHVLGLGHSNDPSSIMSYSHSATDIRLSQDDVDGITYLYPRIEGGGDKVFGCGTLTVAGASGAGKRRGSKSGPFGRSDGGGGSGGAAAELLGFFILCAIATRALKSNI